LKLGSLILPSSQLTCNFGLLGVSVSEVTCQSGLDSFCTVNYLSKFEETIKYNNIFIFSRQTKTLTSTVNGVTSTAYACASYCVNTCATSGSTKSCIRCCTTDRCNTGTATDTPSSTASSIASSTASSTFSFKTILSQMFLLVSSGLFFFIF
jgi:hypothetical protein